MTTLQPLGRFGIRLELIRRDWKKVQQFMREMVVVEARYDFAMDEIKYTALSDLFEPVPLLNDPPWYRVKFITVQHRCADQMWMEVTEEYCLERVGNEACAKCGQTDGR